MGFVCVLVDDRWVCFVFIVWLIWFARVVIVGLSWFAILMFDCFT